jgi:hypothetical protein
MPVNDFGDLLRDKIYKLDAKNQLQQNNYFLSNRLSSTLRMAAFPGEIRPPSDYPEAEENAPKVP